ncbi:hypothetical protein L1987_57962 [Smallanthus sonchifolius]|uniref:Uncharacterized protein n=1 Tax=Smallanthus sonchifolius TaxID=185202 RepID=A0ACB9DF23_9ASTR|nr:hypothetical protein L1987_57962 [Smallanthus sonchifolius]
MMNSIPHFDDVVDLAEDDEEDEVEINCSEAKSKGKKLMSSTGSTTDAFNKKAKGTLYSVFKPSVVSGKKGGNLVGSKEYNDVQKKLRLEAVQKFCRWMDFWKSNGKEDESKTCTSGVVDAIRSIGTGTKKICDQATGAGEAPYSTRASGNKRGAKSKTSSSRSRPRGLVDEPNYDFDVDAEENDVAAYKDFVPTSAPDDDDDDDEPEFFDVSD